MRVKRTCAEAGFLWDRQQRWVPRLSCGCVPTALMLRREQVVMLLPKLLPNALGSAGIETDKERRDALEVPTNRCASTRTGINRDSRKRIRKPLFYPAELRDQLNNISHLARPFGERNGNAYLRSPLPSAKRIFCTCVKLFRFGPVCGRHFQDRAVQRNHWTPFR